MRNDLAFIIRRIGHNVVGSYGPNETSATMGAAKRYLKDRPGYSSVKKKCGYKPNLITDMLNKRLPVLIGADRDGAGHAWVIDGSVTQTRTVKTYRNGVYYSTSTESRSMLHCNFGWGGVADGYYYSNVFNPKEGPVDRESNESSYEETHPKSGRYYKYYRTVIYDIK
jgi:hypothetical protein